MPGAFQAQHSANTIHGITERMDNIDISEDEDELGHDRMTTDDDATLREAILLPENERLVASNATRPERLLLTHPDCARYGAANVHVAAEPYDGHGDTDALLWVLWWGFGRAVHVLRRGAGLSREPREQGLVTHIRCRGNTAHMPGFHLFYRGRRLNTIRLATLDAEQRLRLMDLALFFSARERLVRDAHGSVGSGELKTHQQWIEGLLFEAVEYGLCGGQDCWPALSQLNPSSSAGHLMFDLGN